MILNIYKPKNWTSFDVVARVRNILREKTKNKKIKVGHAGTLDPLAEGVLIVLTHDDTKKQDLIMKKPKEYVADIAFGAESPTYDLEGDLEYFDVNYSLNELEEKLLELKTKYVGEIEQKVPPFSAAKVEGKRLYQKAREGSILDEELPIKRINIFEFDILDVYEQDIFGKILPVMKCRIYCSTGSYLRSIAHDLGNDLGIGGVLINLVRTKVGEFTSEEALHLDQIEDKLLKS